MVIRIEQGKGQEDRHLMLSPKLLEIPCAYLMQNRRSLQRPHARRANERDTLSTTSDHERQVIARWVAGYNERGASTRRSAISHPAAYAAALTATDARLRDPDQLSRSPIVNPRNSQLWRQSD